MYIDGHTKSIQGYSHIMANRVFEPIDSLVSCDILVDIDVGKGNYKYCKRIWQTGVNGNIYRESTYHIKRGKFENLTRRRTIDRRSLNRDLVLNRDWIS
jgi:hypothetical protein